MNRPLANVNWRTSPPPQFPPSDADAWGSDFYGLSKTIVIAGVEQVMRWIAPGRFMMGSPEDEVERREDEQLHEVVLTEGLWLAETACTQELYEAVMGENPSHFKGSQLPVEQVSYDDVERFIEKVNGEYDELGLRLPTESEWEYSCRAGSVSVFNTGEVIHSDQVNFDGNNPYADGEKSEYRGETVEVKSLKANEWGLYEMHGNVLEWCSDWYGRYEQSDSVDPVGPSRGERRVLRGGGWFGSARYCRSAGRDADEPSFRDDDVGFRFAQAAQPVQAERAVKVKVMSEARRSRKSRTDAGFLQRVGKFIKRNF